ncbi:MAG: tetratricopeptide repeat protein [Proteobacteria bacterium]|nr:tetratricopeptide repeat protein [Pseudomonadota bacterium]
MERRLAAILAVDVVGYTRLMGADEAGTLARLKALRGEVIDPEIARYNGRIVKLMGDGALVEFASVVDAVACAVAIQRANAARDAGLAEDARLALRIGVNLGDVIVEGEDIYGDGVNIAARLEGLAEPGGISVSDIVHQSVRAKLDLAFDDLGPQQVKNVAEPVRVYRVRLDPSASGKAFPAKRGWRRPAIAAGIAALAVVAGIAVWQRPWEPKVELASVERMAFPLPDKPSIAVLPFVNMSDDPEQEYFADGMTEDLITDLSKVSGLFVIARNSTFVYKGRSVPVRQVSEDLGVRYVLEGSVRRVGDQVRVNAQLIDATTGGHVWADRYDGNVTDIFAVQDAFVREIVAALALNLSESEQQEIASGQTSNIEAREAFQNGWEHYLRYTPEDNATAAEQFKRAVELDPDYGRAYSALGMVYVRGCQWLWNDELGMTAGGAFNTAVQYLTKGEEYSSSLTKVAASQIYLYDRKHDKAFIEAARAVGQDPNDPEAQVAMGLAMITTGRPEAGLEFVETALRLNPNRPNHYVLAHAMAYFTMNDMEQAASVLAAALERDPGAVELAPMLAASYARLGQRDEARAALQLWKPDASQSELRELVISYHFPYRWSGAREVPERLDGGLEIAALPSDVTVASLLLTLRRAKDPFERRSAVWTLGQFGPAAKAAVPAIQELLDDTKLKFVAEFALKKINGN